MDDKINPFLPRTTGVICEEIKDLCRESERMMEEIGKISNAMTIDEQLEYFESDEYKQKMQEVLVVQEKRAALIEELTKVVDYV